MSLRVIVLFGIAIGIFPLPRVQAQKSTTKPRAATLSQQKMCAAQAHQKFVETYPAEDPNAPTVYTSHYDPRVNVCFMMVHRITTNQDSSMIWYEVDDAFEGRVYASYLSVNSTKAVGQVTPRDCTVRPFGEQPTTCKSSDEFEALVEKRFGIAL
jgi:hypothetical protein